MKQIYQCTPKELYELASQYSKLGVMSRVIQCYERLLWLGKLHQRGYLRLALIYMQRGEKNAAERIIRRYTAIYKDNHE